MNILDIENNIKNITDIIKISKGEFIYELLRCFGIPKASITKLKNGNTNISKKTGEILWRKKLFFKECNDLDIYKIFLEIINDENILKNEPRFIIITNYEDILAFDTKTSETLSIKINELEKNYTFFLPWAGMEKAILQNENPADIKAADRMMKLYDEIQKENNIKSKHEIHGLNVFIARLLFCFFAEDTGIFESKLFTKSIMSNTQVDGSDLNNYLQNIFKILDMKDRRNVAAFLTKFPYVGGGLFKDEHINLRFSTKSRNYIIESGKLDWSSINPDIFGSMIQSVVNPEERSNFGMHYTSVPNIMKVINPLFLEDLYKEFESNKNDIKKLIQLIEKLSKIKVFDPACGSGNFLIIAYKELRILEMKIIEQINKINNQQYFQCSTISIEQFYGIEIDDFAHEIAVISLLLIEHKMNMEFYAKFSYVTPPLPLKEIKNLVLANATRIEWEEVCPVTDNSIIYVIGNPPYIGSKKQDKMQKADMAKVFNGIKDYKNLDYVACWFYIGSQYIKKSNSELAFVSTNSIVQGEQVGLLWPHILNSGLEIGFAHRSFKWGNNAKGKAAVICVIVSLRKRQKKVKYVFSDGFRKEVDIIGPYLNIGSEFIIKKRSKPISNIPIMVYGNMALDNNNLKLNEEERNKILGANKEASKFIRPMIGGEEYLKGIKRYCLWIEDEELEEAVKIDEIKDRIEKVKEFRENGGEVARTLVTKSHQFRYRKVANKNFILVPKTTSENRDYIQCGFFDAEYIAYESAQVIYDCEPYIFGIISSKLHMIWVKTVAGRLKSDYRYSNKLCYNTFPVPELSKEDKQRITDAVLEILEQREKYSEKMIGELYNSNKMPEGLRKAHENLDEVIEKCYFKNKLKTDDERLDSLVKMYKDIVEGEGELFNE